MTRIGVRHRCSDLAVVATIALVASGCGATSSKRALSFRTDHFLCYENSPARAEKTVRRGPSILLRDQFGTQRADRFELTGICNPARENAIPVRNPRAHLACYAPRFSQRSISERRVAITNELDRNDALLIAESDLFCVPSVATVHPGVTLPLPKGLDRFECYRVVRTLSPHRLHSLKLADEFVSFGTRTLVPDLFCNPVSANHSRVTNRGQHLACYVLLANSPRTPSRVVINDQFGRATVAPVPSPVLCVPSRARLVSG